MTGLLSNDVIRLTEGFSKELRSFAFLIDYNSLNKRPISTSQWKQFLLCFYGDYMAVTFWPKPPFFKENLRLALFCIVKRYIGKRPIDTADWVHLLVCMRTCIFGESDFSSNESFKNN